jgi:hypothetical protein
VERRRLRLRPDLPTALVSFGAEGSVEVVKVAGAFRNCRYGVQLIILWVRHEQASAKLLPMRHGVGLVVDNFSQVAALIARLRCWPT